MNSKLIIFSAAFLFFSLNIHALNVDLPNSITFFEEARSINFEVENVSGKTQELNIEVFAPIAFEIKGEKQFLENGETAFIELTFFPQDKYLNSVYESTVLIKLGREIQKEKIPLYFEEKIEEKREETEEQKETFNPVTATGNIFLAGITEFLNPINFILTIIAAILLVLFISRLTKRLNKEEIK